MQVLEKYLPKFSSNHMETKAELNNTSLYCVSDFIPQLIYGKCNNNYIQHINNIHCAF